MESKRTKRRWTWLLSGVMVIALTGCGMYPSHPGDWPNNFWGTVLHTVSHVIDFFAHLFGNNYGLAILIVTVIVRLIILPLFIRQLRYQRVMMELQPEMKKIRSKYKGDNQKIQQETMKLYQEAGTNPAAGCLPMVIQLPVLYALYGAIMGNKGLHESTFLWIFPLGQHDPHYILPVIAAMTTFLSSYLTMKSQPQQQRIILYIMPVFILFIGSRLPAGLVLYWIYTNLFTALQTYFFLTRPTAARAKAGGTSAASAKSSPRSITARQNQPEKRLATATSKSGASSRAGRPGTSGKTSASARTASTNKRSAPNKGSQQSPSKQRPKSNSQQSKPQTAKQNKREKPNTANPADGFENKPSDGRSEQ